VAKRKKHRAKGKVFSVFSQIRHLKEKYWQTATRVEEYS
jgi:hypothetical protein